MKFDLCRNLKEKSPLVHCITNYVTVNDCANILLASGASPIMADDIGEAAEITSICSALDINIGTLNERTIPSMLAAGKRAGELGHPVLLDPVGAGASALRTNTAAAIVDQVRPTVIRGNISELRALALGSATTRGVDASSDDKVTVENIGSVVAWVRDMANRTGAVIVITGETDLVVSGSRACAVKGGHPVMGRITGSGCMLSALMTAAIAASDDAFEGALQCLCMMKTAGERAQKKMAERGLGTSSFRDLLIDEIYLMDDAVLESEAKYELL